MDFQNDNQGGSTRFFPTVYLDSPILTTPYDRFAKTRQHYLSVDSSLWDRSAETVFHRKMSEYQSLMQMNPHTPQLLVPQQYSTLLDSPCAPTEHCKRELELACAAADPVAKAANTAYAKLAGLDQCMGLPDNIGFILPYLREYSQMRFFEQFITKYHGERSQGGKKGKPVQEITAWGINALTDGTLWYFQRMPGFVGPLLMTHEQLLMIKDALYARLNVQIAHDVLYTSTPFRGLIRRAWAWMEKSITMYGNEGYEIAKSIESLTKTYLSVVANCALPEETGSFKDMIHKVSEKERKEIKRRNDIHAGSVSDKPILAWEFADILVEYPEFFKLVEVFGLQKCTGHPMIDPERGGISAAKEAKQPDETLYTDAKSLRNSWMRIFIESYVHKHGRYPEFTSKPQVGTELYRLWRLNQLNIHRTSYPLSDLDSVVLSQHFDFDYYDDYLSLLDDKAISFKRTERHLFWDRDTGEKTSTSARLVIEMMTRPEIDPHKIVEAIEEGRIPLDWLIVSITPKEREFKLDPRMFAMFVLEMRHFFAMHEANLATTILPYIPQLTMTDSHHDVQERFLNLTKAPEVDDRLTLLLEFDLSRWNLLWRKLCIHMIGKDLNDLFGMKNVFTTGHSFFEECIISVRVPGLRPPDAEDPFPVDSILEWGKHLGGFEGILQKLWSIATVAMMDKGLADLPIAYTWTIQGDNVTAVVTLPPAGPNTTPQEHLLSWKALILERAEATTLSVNQLLKPEECVASTKVLTYSKDVYKEGVEFFTSLKFYSRIFPSTADDFPGIASQLSAIYSGCTAAADRTKNSPAGFFLALAHGAIYLARLSQYDRCYIDALSLDQKRCLRNPNFLRYVLLLPSELGGIATLSMADFLYKGGSDPLSKNLVTIFLLRSTLPLAERIYQESYNARGYNLKLTIQALIKDPKGLPVSKPMSPSDSVAEESRNVMRVCSNNPHIRDVMSKEIENWDAQLCEHLSRVQPLAVDILHDLRASSIAGRAETLSRTFTATRSLQALGKKYADTDLVRVVISQARRQLTSLITRYTTRSVSKQRKEDITLHTWVSTLRDITWGSMGFRPQGVDSHLPFDFPMIYGERSNLSGISLMAQYVCDQNTSYVAGPFPPMKGSKTRETKSSRGYTIVTTNPAASAVKDQQRIKAFAQGDEKMQQLIDSVALTRTSVNLSVLSPVMIQKDGGNNVHRYRSEKGEDSAYVLGQGSNCGYTTVNTDRIEGVSASSTDYAFMLQEQIVFLQAVAALRRLESEQQSEYDRIQLLVQSSDLTVLPDDSLTLDGDMTLQPVSLYNNPLVYVPDVLVKRISGPVITPTFPLDTCEEMDLSLILAALKSMSHRMLGQLSELTGAGGTVIRRSERILDILEFKSLGLRLVLRTFSRVLAERIVLTLAQKWDERKVRAVTNLLCLKQGPTLISSVSRYIRHPSLQNDDLLQQMGIGPGPTYQGRRIDEARMLSYVTRHTIKLLCDHHSELYCDRSIMFVSDNPECISRELELMAYLTVLSSQMEGELPEEEVEGTLISLRTNMSAMAHSDEPLRQSRLYTLFLIWADGLETRYPVCSSKLRQLAKRPRISVSPLTTTRALRAARSLNIFHRYVPVIHTPIHNHVLLQPLVIPTYLGTLTQSFNGVSISSWASSIWGTREERISKDLFYNTGNNVMYASSALSAWWGCQFLFRDRHIVVVGAGNGAAALVAITGGAASVLGLDLRSDLPREEAMSEDYTPPLVRLYGDSSKYLQAPQSFTTSGDWFKTNVYTTFIMSIPRRCLVVIDIQGEIGYSPSALQPLISMGWEGDVLLRWQGGRQALLTVVGTLLSVLDNLVVYGLRNYTDHNDVLISGTLLPSRTLIPGIIEEIHPNVIHSHLPSHMHSKEWIFDIFFAPIGGPSSYYLPQAIDVCLSTINDLAGEYTTRPSYSSWTRVLQVGIACQWLRLDRDEQLPYLLSITAEGYVDLLLSSHTIQVTVTESLIRIITHLAARLLTT